MSAFLNILPFRPLQRLLRRRAAVTEASSAHHAVSASAIIVRDRRFHHAPREGEGASGRFWHGGGKAVSIYFDNLSVFFPHGERFFMQSVKAFQDKAPEGSELRAAVRAFYAQEAYHGREHRAYNARLQELGYPVEAMEERLAHLLTWVTQRTSKRFHLGVTAALEHFTAMMGYHLLSTPALLDGSDPELAALWLWHAVEENEHKAVAFDLFKAAGGTRFEQHTAMLVTASIFWLKVVEHQVRMMRAVNIASDWKEWRALLRFMFVEPGNLAKMPVWIRAYLKPGFHPNELDSSGVIAAWREAAGELQGQEHA